MSGGGGWGPKQGLLSLDPENTLADAIDARYDFDMVEPSDSAKIHALGNIAKPGSWVQFVTLSVMSDRGGEVGDSSKTDSEGVALSDLVLGSIPSSIDELPLDMASSTGELYADPPVIETLLGRFGAQSEKGVYVRYIPENSKPTPQREVQIMTKIDVPFAHICWGNDPNV